MSTSPRESVILVTGAGGGIGRAIVERLASMGLRVVASDLYNPGGLPAEHFLTGDITSMGSDLAQRCVEVAGRIDGLVHAAGVLETDEDASSDSWKRLLDVNLVAAIDVCRGVAALLREQGSGGSIVTVASNAGLVPRLGLTSYCVSKAGLIMFTKCLGLELARDGIRCNAVAPGSTNTPMLRQLHDDGSFALTIEGVSNTYRTGIPLGRVAEPEDIAETVAFLMTEAARHLTMQVVTVDGGAVLGV